MDTPNLDIPTSSIRKRPVPTFDTLAEFNVWWNREEARVTQRAIADGHGPSGRAPSGDSAPVDETSVEVNATEKSVA